MKRCILASLCCLALALCFPLLAFRFRETPEADSSPPEGAAVPEVLGEAESDLPRDAQRLLTVLMPDGSLQQMSMAEYLPGVLAGEMPASFEPEALRAQAVAARSFLLCRASQRSAAHPEADVCTSAACCLAWCSEAGQREKWGEDYEFYAARTAGAVAATDGAVLTWEDKPILACFHASSAGQTESSAAVWNGALPYLVSVSSPETDADVPNYITALALSAEDFRAALLAEYPSLTLEGDPADWLGESVPDESGRVEHIAVGGAALSGTALRSLFALRSAAFTLEWTGTEFLFTVTGSGHGVGMSQYGANVMAREGGTWQDILAHYYPGAELTYSFS